MRKRTGEFRVAIEEALTRLIEKRQPFSASSVIREARYPDGATVGATTLYRRVSGAGKFAYEDLIRKIGEASKEAGKTKQKPHAADDAAVKDELAQLLLERNGLSKALVDQQSLLIQLRQDNSHLESRLADLEDEKYVLCLVISQLSGGVARSAVAVCSRFEAAAQDTHTLSLLKKRADHYLKEVLVRKSVAHIGPREL